MTHERRRKWTGLAVALTVTFTVCDAQQIGFLPSDGFLLPGKNLALLRMVRPEQKAPSLLAALSAGNQAFASRKQAAGAPGYFNAAKCFRYALITPACWLRVLGLRFNSCESPRAPPLMDPPIFC